MPWGIAGALETVLMTISVIALRLAYALPALKIGVLACGDNRRDYDDMNDGFAFSCAHAAWRMAMPSLRAVNAENSQYGRFFRTSIRCAGPGHEAEGWHALCFIVESICYGARARRKNWSANLRAVDANVV